MPTLLHGFIEPDLLTTPAKFGIIAITCFHRILHPFELEVALGIVLLLLAAIVFAAMPRGRAGKMCALMLFACSTAIIFTYSLAGPLQQHLQRQDNPSPAQPLLLLSKFPAPIHREHLVISNEDGYFREASSRRIVLLRGVNFGSKTPREFPTTAKILNRDAFHTTKVSFLDRPCALKECGEHFARLRTWGFTVLRLLITWESIEPNEPGVYDVEYLEFIQQFSSLAGSFGLSIIIDPHQDVWSRFTGGDGAPAWTLRAAGFNLSALHETNAAIVHHEALLRNESYPIMIWPTGYGKLAVATMFTLFFGGNDFAPNMRVGEQTIQDYLQEHYIAALQQVARVLRRERNVLGFDTMNEPNQGYIGLETLHRSIFPVPLGLHTSAFAGMMLGAGFAKRVNRFAPRPFVFAETVLANPQHASAWNSHEEDIWRNHGVWDIDAKGHPKLLRPGHFKLAPGATFTQRYFVPFLRKLTAAVRSEAHDYFIFAEPAISLLEEKQVLEQAPNEAFELLGGRFAWAPHMYDGGTLMTKSYHSWFALDAERGTLVFGARAARDLFVRVGQTLKRSGMGWPVLVGETGVPMDMANSAQALDRTLSGFERSFLSWTLWNYMPGNTKRYGDGWNGEDLSLFSEGKPRFEALRAAIRPYPLKLAGEPLETWFDMDSRKFFLKVRLFIHAQQQQEALETEIFVPAIQYAKSISWRVGGRGSSFVKHAAVAAAEQMLVWRHDVSPGATSVEPNELFVDQWIEIEAKE